MRAQTRLVASLLGLWWAANAVADPLLDGFRQPPAIAHPHVWWHWTDGNVDLPGIRADLQWLQRIGMGGVVMAESGLPTVPATPQRVAFGTPAWQEALHAAASTSAELGLSLGVFSSGGWSISGGPWVAPEDAMQARLELSGLDRPNQERTAPAATTRRGWPVSGRRSQAGARRRRPAPLPRRGGGRLSPAGGPRGGAAASGRCRHQRDDGARARLASSLA